MPTKKKARGRSAGTNYLREIFDPTLLFSFLAAILGAAAAYHYGVFNFTITVLVVVGAVLAQMAANLLDDYFDYRKGLDRYSVKTQYSGGSALLGHAKSKLPPSNVLALGIIVLLIALAIGGYLLSTTAYLLPILVIIIIGAVSAVLYPRVLSRVPYMSEPLVMLNFALVCFGSFILLAGASHIYQLLFVFVPAGIMPAAALLNNSVPDSKTDKTHGRRHAAIMLGDNRKVAIYYLSLQSIAYAILAVGVIYAYIPLGTIVVLATIPTSIFVFSGIANYRKAKEHEKFMGLHSQSSFLILLLLIIAFVI